MVILCFVIGIIFVFFGGNIPTSDFIPPNRFWIITANGYFVLFISMGLFGVGFVFKSLFDELKNLWNKS